MCAGIGSRPGRITAPHARRAWSSVQHSPGECRKLGVRSPRSEPFRCRGPLHTALAEGNRPHHRSRRRPFDLFKPIWTSKATKPSTPRSAPRKASSSMQARMCFPPIPPPPPIPAKTCSPPIPLFTPVPDDTLDSRQKDLTHTILAVATETWQPSGRQALTLAAYARTYSLALDSNFGLGLIAQSEFRTVGGGNATYTRKFGRRLEALAGMDYRRDAPRALDLAKADAEGRLQLATSNDLTVTDYGPFAALEGDLGHSFHAYAGARRDAIQFRRHRQAETGKLVHPNPRCVEPQGNTHLGPGARGRSAAAFYQLRQGIPRQCPAHRLRLRPRCLDRPVARKLRPQSASWACRCAPTRALRSAQTLNELRASPSSRARWNCTSAAKAVRACFNPTQSRREARVLSSGSIHTNKTLLPRRVPLRAPPRLFHLLRKRPVPCRRQRTVHGERNHRHRCGFRQEHKDQRQPVPNRPNTRVEPAEELKPFPKHHRRENRHKQNNKPRCQNHS